MERMLYTVEEVARMLGLGRTKVYELIKVGELGSVLIGQARRIPAEAVAEFLTRLTVQRGTAVDVHTLPGRPADLSLDGAMMSARADVEEAG